METLLGCCVQNEEQVTTVLNTTSARRYERALSAFLALFVPNIKERIRGMVKHEDHVLKEKARENRVKKSQAHSAHNKLLDATGKAQLHTKLQDHKAAAAITNMASLLTHKKEGNNAPNSPGGPDAPAPEIQRSISNAPSSGTRTLSSFNSPSINSPNIDDALLWAVLVRDFKLTEALWQTLTTDGDPIRMALVAASTAREAAKRDVINTMEYEEHAQQYMAWGTEVRRPASKRRPLLLPAAAACCCLPLPAAAAAAAG